MVIDVAACLPVLIWLYLLALRGGFWRTGRLLAPPPMIETPARRIVAIVPARDEAEVIGRAVQSLLRQRLPGSIHVIVVDDGSTDGTARVATEAAGVAGAASSLTVIAGAPLPQGWSGKVWAMSQGAARAAQMGPDYLLFTDADIHHDPDNVATLVARAENAPHDLVSYMVKLSATSFADRCLIPAFVFFFFKLYPPAWVAARGHRVAAAAGGCVLIRPQALARAGGLAAIRSEIIDDCALARIVKRSGGSIWLGLTRTAESLRAYGSFAEIARMISRTAFNQLQHSYALLAGTMLGLFATYLLPPLLLFSGRPVAMALGAAAWLLMGLAYAPMVRFYELSLLWCLTLPAVAAFYAGATLFSALQYARGSGGRWKGRAQDRPAIDA